MPQYQGVVSILAANCGIWPAVWCANKVLAAFRCRLVNGTPGPVLFSKRRARWRVRRCRRCQGGLKSLVVIHSKEHREDHRKGIKDVGDHRKDESRASKVDANASKCKKLWRRWGNRERFAQAYYGRQPENTPRSPVTPPPKKKKPCPAFLEVVSSKCRSGAKIRAGLETGTTRIEESLAV